MLTLLRPQNGASTSLCVLCVLLIVPETRFSDGALCLARAFNTHIGC